MSLFEFAQYAAIVLVYLVVFTVIFDVLLVAGLVFLTKKSMDYMGLLLPDIVDTREDVHLTDFDRHVATTPGIIDNTND